MSLEYHAISPLKQLLVTVYKLEYRADQSVGDHIAQSGPNRNDLSAITQT